MAKNTENVEKAEKIEKTENIEKTEKAEKTKNIEKNENISVVVVDDHELVRTGLKRMLVDIPGISVVGDVDSGEDAVSLVRKVSPNVVLMDIRMPGMGGIEATRKILQVNPDTKVLIITAYEDNVLYPLRLLREGISGYLTKGASANELIYAIRSVHMGERYVSPEIAQKLVLSGLGQNEGKNPFDDLSNREMQIAAMIGKGQKVKEIAKELNLSPKTINSYRYRIFDKMKIKNDVELAKHSIKYGLVENASAD
jgi:two-component system invasion response regulator UvrY